MSLAKSSVLVAYAGKDETTRRIAEVIGETLQAAKLRPRVRTVAEVADVEPYAAVILGSDVHMFGWSRSAVAFGRRHERALKNRPVWMFSSDPVMHPISVAGLPGRRAARLGSRLRARGHALFTGEFEPGPHGGGQWRLPGDASGSRQDFAQVREWTVRIARELGAGGSASAGPVPDPSRDPLSTPGTG